MPRQQQGKSALVAAVREREVHRVSDPRQMSRWGQVEASITERVVAGREPLRETRPMVGHVLELSETAAREDLEPADVGTFIREFLGGLGSRQASKHQVGH